MSLHRECHAPTTLTLRHALLLLLLLLTEAPPPVTAQIPNVLPPPPPDRVTKLKFDKSMAIVLVILVVVFFLLGFLSVYTRQCAERRMRGRLDLSIPIVGGGSRRRRGGLDREVIDTFPTFVYSTVKGLKIGRATLECAVCLNEFEDDETLRLIPKCSHVFHPECIDAWLANHYTCPVCRANLVPRPGDPAFVAIQIPDPDAHGSNRPDPGSDSDVQALRNDDDSNNQTGTAESPKVNNSVNQIQNRPPRSRSTGFRIASLFPRSHSTGHSLVQPGENHERFTLRLPEEVRNQLMLSRTTSSGVAFMRESSVRRGYRTRSVGSGPGRSYLQYERFGRSDRRGLSLTPLFLSRAGSTRSNKSPVAKDEVGERPSDRLFAGSEN